MEELEVNAVLSSKIWNYLVRIVGSTAQCRTCHTTIAFQNAAVTQHCDIAYEI